MNNSILEQLYNGEIYPFETLNIVKEEHKEINLKISNEKQHFKDILSNEEWTRFEKMEDIQATRSSSYDLANFTYAFRLGARIILEIIEEKDPNYEVI